MTYSTPFAFTLGMASWSLLASFGFYWTTTTPSLAQIIMGCCVVACSTLMGFVFDRRKPQPLPVNDLEPQSAVEPIAPPLVPVAAPEPDHTSSDALHDIVDMSIRAQNALTSVSLLLLSVETSERTSQSMTSTANQLFSSIAHIADNSAIATQQAEDAERAADHGVYASGSTADAMKNIGATVQQASETATRLEASSQEINSITQEMESIAAQTNLLALNATIEAARAGEAGKGFVVVAGEVKNLANQSARAADDIEARISQLREDMQDIYQSMQHGADAVKEGQETVNGLTLSLSSISAQVRTVTERMSEISALLQDQSIAAEEVTANSETLAAISQTNQTRIQQVLKSVQSISHDLDAQIIKVARPDNDIDLVERAKLDHVIYKKRLVSALVGEDTIPQNGLSDHHNCRLGKWYDGIQDTRVRQLASFKAMDAPHQAVHDHGFRMLDAIHNHDRDTAISELHHLEAASEEVLRLLEAIRQDLLNMGRATTTLAA